MASRADNIASNLSLANFSKATELRQRIWFTIGVLVVFRLLSFECFFISLFILRFVNIYVSILRNSSSLIILTPNRSAFSSFLGPMFFPAIKKSVLDEEDLEVIRNGHNYYEYTGFYGPVRDTGFLTDQEKNTFQAQTYGLYSDSEQQQHFLDKYGVDTYIHPNYIKAVPEYIGRAIDSASLAMFSGDEHLTYHHRSFRIPFKSTLSYDQYCPPDSPRAGRDRVYACPMEVPGERYPPTYYEKEDCVSVSATSIKEWPGNEPGLGYGGGIPVNANEKIEYRVSLDFVHIKDYSFTLGGRQGR